MSESMHLARGWIAQDPDPRTRARLAELLEAAQRFDSEAATELDDLFAGRLAFGTAGLRAAMGPGPLRMNRLVIQQTAQGLLRFAEQSFAAEDTSASPSDSAPASSSDPASSEAPVPRIVIGFDARFQSDEFAYDTAQIFIQAGWNVWLFDRPGPTPLLARQVLQRDADLGVMVTASHNPPQDNGYKVYLGGRLSKIVEPDGMGVGAQITSPVDQRIAQIIADIAATALADVPADQLAQADHAEGIENPDDDGASAMDASGNTTPVPPENVSFIGAAERQSYQNEALELCDPDNYPDRDLRVVYTAMHGVGGDMVTELLAAAGFDQVSPVSAQFTPDPHFPTADFPNPEEPGALDLALEQAAAEQADLVLANDPDADRLSAAVYDPQRGQYRQLSGDEIGALLGQHVLRRGPLRDGWQWPGTDTNAQPALANSVVSSRLLGALAAHHGVPHDETLTGFKWLARVPNMMFGYEEAIGFDVDPAHIRDKDGISAALILCELAASLKAQGSTLLHQLEAISAEVGVFLTSQITITVDALDQLGEITSRLRDTPPRDIADVELTQSIDLRSEPLPGKEFSAATSTDALMYYTAADDRVIIRPSGTEPKVKCYLETCAIPVSADPEAVSEAREKAQLRLHQLRSAMTSLLTPGN